MNKVSTTDVKLMQELKQHRIALLERAQQLARESLECKRAATFVTDKAIAEKFGIDRATVRRHLTGIRRFRVARK